MSDTVPAAGRRLWRDEFLLQRLVERNEAAAVQRIAAAQEKDAEVFMGERAGDGNVFCIHPSILHTPSDIRGHTVYFPKNIYHRSELSSSADGGADEREFRPDIGANSCVKLEVRNSRPRWSGHTESPNIIELGCCLLRRAERPFAGIGVAEEEAVDFALGLQHRAMEFASFAQSRVVEGSGSQPSGRDEFKGKFTGVGHVH